MSTCIIFLILWVTIKLLFVCIHTNNNFTYSNQYRNQVFNKLLMLFVASNNIIKFELLDFEIIIHMHKESKKSL